MINNLILCCLIRVQAYYEVLQELRKAASKLEDVHGHTKERCRKFSLK